MIWRLFIDVEMVWDIAGYCYRELFIYLSCAVIRLSGDWLFGAAKRRAARWIDRGCELIEVEREVASRMYGPSIERE